MNTLPWVSLYRGTLSRRISAIVMTAQLTLFGALTAPPAAAEATIHEQVIGPAFENGTLYTLSPKGMRLATVSAKGSRFIVTVDGVEGEKYDEILKSATGVEAMTDIEGFFTQHVVRWQGPVAFSPDGSRFAYAARLGQEMIVILDGKEVLRGEYHTLAPKVAMLSFSPDSKHFYYLEHTGETMGSYRLMMDGKAVTPSSVGLPYPIFSPDGKHWALAGQTPMQEDKVFLVVDGKQVGYYGKRLLFAPDGRLLVISQGQQGAQSLLVNGKELTAARSFNRVVINSKGDIAVIATDSNGGKRLFINGKPIDGTERAGNVVFSPDGNHMALVCYSHPSTYVIQDGKKHLEYSSIRSVAFTPDSSKLVYIAETGVKKFVVVNGQEDEGNPIVNHSPIFGESGNHVAYFSADGRGSQRVYYDDKVFPNSRGVSALTLSPDGSRIAYYAATDAMSGKLIVDGEIKGGGTANYTDTILFSPDSRRIAAWSSGPDGRRALYLDGNFVYSPTGYDEYSKVLAFTPDSQHVLIKRNARAKDGSHLDSYFLDGHMVAQFSAQSMIASLVKDQAPPPLWEMQPDGSVLIVGPEPTETRNSYGPMKRIKATPQPGTNIETWFAEIEAAKIKAAADAEAAKAQKEADAAKAKAEAEALRAKKAEEAAKAKAEAAAAKAKAREDANAARAKAREDAAAAQKAKRANQTK